MSKVKDHENTILKDKKTVITRSYFWKVPHNSSPDEIHLKIGRYKKPKGFLVKEEVDELKPKSELTLDGEEFQNLIKSMQ